MRLLWLLRIRFFKYKYCRECSSTVWYNERGKFPAKNYVVKSTVPPDLSLNILAFLEISESLAEPVFSFHAG